MLARGESPEEVARTLHQMRRDLGTVYKDATPQPLRNYIYELNVNRYKDPLGIPFEEMIENKTFLQIIESSSRPNANIDGLLIKFEEWLRSQ